MNRKRRACLTAFITASLAMRSTATSTAAGELTVSDVHPHRRLGDRHELLLERAPKTLFVEQRGPKAVDEAPQIRGSMPEAIDQLGDHLTTNIAAGQPALQCLQLELDRGQRRC